MVMHYGGMPCDLDEIYASPRARRRGDRGLRACVRRLLSRTADRLTRRPARVLLSGGQEPPARRWRRADRSIGRGRRAASPAALVRHRPVDVRAERRRLYQLGVRGHRARYERGDERHRGRDRARPAALRSKRTTSAGGRSAAATAQGIAGTPGSSSCGSTSTACRAATYAACSPTTANGSSSRSPRPGSTSASTSSRATRYPMFTGGPLPGVESFWRRAVSLPVHLALTDDDVERVIETIRAGW